MSRAGAGMRALYTQISFPGMRKQGEDERSYDEKLRKSENLLNQNFLTVQQQMGELAEAILSLQEWAGKVGQ